MIAFGIVAAMLLTQAPADAGVARNMLDSLATGKPLPPRSEAVVRGRLDVKAIELGGKKDDAFTRYVTARLRAFQGCYEHELRDSPKLAGTVTIETLVTTAGRSGEITVTDDLGAEKVTNCTRAIIKAWTYPFKPDAPQTVKIVYTVKPNG